MTRELVLMRHAKSSWRVPAIGDHDRPLNGRGRRSARALGDWLRAAGHLPDAVLCSSARRTRDTLAGLALEAPVRCLDALYHAEPEAMLALLRQAQGARVLMLGHNPGLADLAQALVAVPPAHPRFADYPTGATLVAAFDIAGWGALRPGTGRVLDFVVPRDLID